MMKSIIVSTESIYRLEFEYKTINFIKLTQISNLNLSFESLEVLSVLPHSSTSIYVLRLFIKKYSALISGSMISLAYVYRSKLEMLANESYTEYRSYLVPCGGGGGGGGLGTSNDSCSTTKSGTWLPFDSDGMKIPLNTSG